MTENDLDKSLIQTCPNCKKQTERLFRLFPEGELVVASLCWECGFKLPPIDLEQKQDA